jgi:NAD(P)H-quinone oxidoreductase subunit I
LEVAALKFERYGLGIAKGMALTFRHLFRAPITVQYPDEKLVISRRTRGNELVWFPLSCTGCSTCAKACPQGNIIVQTHRGGESKLDTGRCMFCGLCVESCPYNALAMGLSYECAKYRRGDLVMNKEQLSVSHDRQPSAYSRPQFDDSLPEQSLLLYDREKGGQKLHFLPLSKRKRGSGA